MNDLSKTPDLKPVSNGDVRVQLHGGLGNQLFQAAVGLALATRCGARLTFDITRFRKKGLRAYALDGLSIPARVVPPQPAPISSRAVAAASKLLGRPTIRRPAGWRGAIFVEKKIQFDPAVLDLQPDVLLAGFYQSPLYFDAIADTIRDSYDATHLMPAPIKALGDDFAARPTVSVHLRLGDYAASDAAHTVHGVLGPNYYERAIAEARSRIPDAEFVVFSDDPSVAREKASSWGARAVDGNSAIEDLWLMSRCRHHIIANSSFSWWGAWLGDVQGALVIAPEQWFAPTAPSEFTTEDLMPAHWLRL